MFIWLTGFAGETTERVTEKVKPIEECVGGVINLENLRYCAGALSGVLTNLGAIDLKNISLTIYYPAAPVQTLQLCDIGDNKVQSCSVSNLTAKKGGSYWFNITNVASGIVEVRLITACPGIYDRVGAAAITLAC